MGITIGTVINDNRGTPPTLMDARLMLHKTKVLFNPHMVDTLRSNLQTSIFAKNKRLIFTNFNWTPKRSQSYKRGLKSGRAA
jgi:hypothetical protein